MGGGRWGFLLGFSFGHGNERRRDPEERLKRETRDKDRQKPRKERHRGRQGGDETRWKQMKRRYRELGHELGRNRFEKDEEMKLGIRARTGQRKKKER